MDTVTTTPTTTQVFPIERNAVTVKFVPDSIRKGASAGTKFLNFSEDTTLEDIVGFLGKDDAKSILVGKCRIIFQDASKAATNGRGEFSIDAFKNEVKNLSAQVESKGVLTAKKDTLVVQLTELTKSAAEKMGQPATDGSSPNLFLQEFNELSRQITALNIAIDNRSRKKDTEDDAD